MKRILASLAAASVALGIVALGCAASDTVSTDETNPTGTGGAATGGAGGVGGAPRCEDPSTDCPAPESACVTAACDAAGQCTTTPAAKDTPCTDAGGEVCDGDGACVECTDAAAHCPPAASECVVPACNAGACATTSAPEGTPTSNQMPGDCKQEVCDGASATKVVDDDADPTDDLEDCTTDTCAGGMNVHTPVAEGMACATGVCGKNTKAGTCVACVTDLDCSNGDLCDTANDAFACVPPTCQDGVKGGQETGIDCGGPVCGPCPDGQGCVTDVDCTSGFCNGGVCAPCATNADCASNQFCDTALGACTADQSNGAPCSSSAQCSSAQCTDGVCCDQACAGNCVACSAAKKGQGIDGVCGNVASGTDPDSECATDAVGTCDHTGTCSGQGACANYAVGTVCAPSTCAAGTQQKADTCDGSGTCLDGGIMGCGNYQCDAGGVACLTMCASASDCAASAFCNAMGQCVAKLGNGTPCSSSAQCQSAVCADGVCCNVACAGTCSACTAAKKGQGVDGACGPIVIGSDPDNECATQAQSTCGTTGACNGVSACQLYAAGLVCAPQTCAGGVQQNADTCNGSGTCADGGSTNCSPYQCNAAQTACLTSCASDSDCVAADYCNVSACVPKIVNGGACSAGAQCQSGSCVDGVCCNTACTGTCSACSAAKKGQGANGVCGTVASGLDPDNECATQMQSTCGTTGVCDGLGACQVYGSGVVCAAQSCMGGVQQNADICNGSGTCQDGGTTNCAPYVCNSAQTACLTICLGDGDCVANNYCNANQCVPKVANGGLCGGPNQCVSGFCVDGVCCNSACGGMCQACSAAKKGAGADGTCGNISPGGDPDNECAGAYGCGGGGGCQTCSDAVKNGSETGVDCGGGGACAKCANGQGCLVNTDCVSNNCVGGTCQPAGPVCGDGVIGAGEQCDDSNTTANDGCSPTCQCEVSVIKTVGPGLNVSVPDDTYSGTIASMACVNVVIPAVTGCSTTVSSVVVTEGMSHTWVGDLVLKLLAPDNTTVTLMSRPGFVEAADDGTGCCGFSGDLVTSSPVTFQMGAATSAENMGSAGVVVCQGDGICTFAPNAGAAAPGTLNTFIGHTAAGTWKFCAGDGGTGDLGTIDRVTLTIGK